MIKLQLRPLMPINVNSSGRGGGRWFFRLLGLTLVGGGGTVGYAWYDSNFKETVQKNVPYSKEAFDELFKYLPPPPEKPLK